MYIFLHCFYAILCGYNSWHDILSFVLLIIILTRSLGVQGRSSDDDKGDNDQEDGEEGDKGDDDEGDKGGGEEGDCGNGGGEEGDKRDGEDDDDDDDNDNDAVMCVCVCVRERELRDELEHGCVRQARRWRRGRQRR
jgi:hypothetical protein